MKSTLLKKKDYSLAKKYLAIYALLFFGAILVLIEHYSEDALDADRIQTAMLEERSEAGYTAPGFTVRNLKGNLDSLANYKGQVVLLNLWATWCGPCRIEMPALENLYRRFRSEGMTILAVSLDVGNDQGVKDFVEEYKLSFPVLIDSDGDVERLYPSFTIPSTFVIDRRGRVVFKVDGAKNWESEETFRAVEYLLKGT